MKHSIRQRVLDPVTGLTLTKIEAVNGELGSGIFDKNGREIFEGDIVHCTDCNSHPYPECTFTTVFKDGAFWTGKDNLGKDVPILNSALIYDLEVVGHVDD